MTEKDGIPFSALFLPKDVLADIQLALEGRAAIVNRGGDTAEVDEKIRQLTNQTTGAVTTHELLQYATDDKRELGAAGKDTIDVDKLICQLTKNR
jgi:hypothetical protein